jgi:hypothetical protein
MAKAKSPTKKATIANGEAGTNGATSAPKSRKIASALQTSSAADSKATNGAVPHPSTATDTSAYPSVSEERIRQRAYELYVQRGGHDGGHVDDWFRAEAELRGRR